MNAAFEGEPRRWRQARVEPRPAGDDSRVVLFVLLRLTGLMLAVLVLGHFTFTHILNDVTDTDSAFIARRWNSVLWIVWDWLMLAAAIAHGAAGLWIAIDDYSSDPASRLRRHRALLAVSLVAVSIGTATIISART